MTLTLRLCDEQATALEATTAAEGLSVKQWIQKLAGQGRPPKRAVAHEKRSGAELVAALQNSALIRAAGAGNCVRSW